MRVCSSPTKPQHVRTSMRPSSSIADASRHVKLHDTNPNQHENATTMQGVSSPSEGWKVVLANVDHCTCHTWKQMEPRICQDTWTWWRRRGKCEVEPCVDATKPSGFCETMGRTPVGSYVTGPPRMRVNLASQLQLCARRCCNWKSMAISHCHHASKGKRNPMHPPPIDPLGQNGLNRSDRDTILNDNESTFLNIFEACSSCKYKLMSRWSKHTTM